MVRWMRGLVSLTLVVVSLCPVTFADQESKAKKLDELMKLTGLYNVIEQQRQAIGQQAEAFRLQILQEFKTNVPEVGQEVWEKFDAASAKFVAASKPSWTAEEAVKLYADLYGADITEDELDQILAYYKSPIGQKDIAASLAAVPKWTAFLTEKNQEVLQRNLQTFMGEIRQIVSEARKPTKPKE